MKTSWKKQATLFILTFLVLVSLMYPAPAYALAIPTLIAPPNNTTTTVAVSAYAPLAIPELKWAAVSGATSYRVQVSSDIAFTTRIVDITTPNTAYTPISSLPFSDGVWYWRVRVEAPAPVGTYSGSWQFTKQWASAANLPVLIAPADGDTIDFYDNPVFSWNPVTGAARYRLQIYSSPGGWSTLLYNITTLATSHQPFKKLANGTSYYWRVVPMDPGNHDGTPSQERSFNASYNPPLTPLTPLDGATPTFTPSFSWTAVRGAQFYRLQYTTDSAFSSGITQVDTRNTTHTPVITLPNDVNYYWRVRVHSDSSVSNWTATRSFIKRWYIKPRLLTPTVGYQHQRFPFFSWTPVPGAAKYKVDLSAFPNFTTVLDTEFVGNTFYSPDQYSGNTTSSIYYWRVTPYDGNDKAGVISDLGSYAGYSTSIAPHQVYPLFYYTPDAYEPEFAGVTTNPHEDRTVPLPIFIWHRVYQPSSVPNAGEVYADAYRVQVDDDPLFNSVNWTVDTENTVATPTVSNPFSPLTNTTYYWRVCSLVGGICDENLWSQRWETRFNPAKGLTPTGGAAPQVIRPTNGFEYAEATPLLEWFPKAGATSYDVEISLNETFSSTVDTATVSYPAYAPSEGLAQRSLGALDFGVYYWRVRQSPSGTWSATQRFQIAAQSQWRLTRVSGAAANQLQIGSDPVGDVSTDYDLTDLQASQAIDHWYYGFHVPSAPSQNVTYALYLDLDHKTASGATFDAYNPAYNVTTISHYRPEYAIYILQEGGVFAANKVYIYHWTGSSWATPQILSVLGGSLTQTGNYVELKITNTTIGYQDTTASYTASLFSLPAGGTGAPQDSVPSDPNVPGVGAISRFSSVTERMNLVAPPNNAGIDPTAYSSVLPVFWDWPILAPYGGAIMRASLDSDFTTVKANYILTSNTAYYAPSSHAWEYDFIGDTTYYWRVQPRYLVGIHYIGAWSQPWRFERKGFIPQNLQASVTFATPTFSWDRVEGAQYYEIQVDDDPNFFTPAINTSTRENSYTDINTLANAVYYWRVNAHRYAEDGNVVVNGWSPNQSFTLALPKPTGLTPASGTVVNRAPTLCWTPLIKNSTGGIPVLAAWKYRIQISKDATFSIIFDSMDTEQSCWTPTKGYDDGQYYWRIAMFDGSNKLGGYTTSQTFTKQYAKATLLSPANGSSMSTMPRFSWTPVNGASAYKLEVSQFVTFSPTVDSIITENTSYTPVKKYPVGSTYYWRVAIIDKDGRIGPFNNATIILTAPTLTVTSVAAQDGWILESSETSNVGGTMSAPAITLLLGDHQTKQQYRSILSFTTGAGLPDTAVISKVILKLTKGTVVGGGNPVGIFQGFMVDIKNGFLGTSAALQITDFQAAANQTYGPFLTNLVSNSYSIDLTGGQAHINKLATNGGLTQIRLRFKLDDNNNAVANSLSLYSGNIASVASRPQLIITYSVP